MAADEGSTTPLDTELQDPAAVAEPPLTHQALRGVAWNWGAALVLIAAQVASTAATARLVSPSQFGVYACGLAAAGIAGYFTLPGLGPGLQRRSSLGKHSVGTALTLSLSASLLVALVLFATATLWADAWNVPGAASIVRTMALTALLYSSATVPIGMLRRRLRFRTTAVIETGSLVGGLAVGVALAVALHSALALALGQAAGAGLLLVAAGVTARRELAPLRFDRDEARELFGFASQVGGLNFLAYLTYAAPSWYAARVFGAATLGIYSRANLIVGLPAEYALTSIQKVIYPIYGRVRDEAQRTRSLIGETLALTTGLTWPVLGLIAGSSPVIVAVLLGDRWGEVTDLLGLFALMAAAWIPCGVLTNSAEALGWMRIIAVRQTCFFAAVIAVLLLATLADLSLSLVVLGVGLAEWTVYALTLRAFIARDVFTGRQVARGQLIHAAIAAAMFGVSAGAAAALDGMPLWLRFAGQLLIAGAALAAIGFGRRWIPAIAILAARLGAPPDQSMFKATWSALR